MIVLSCSPEQRNDIEGKTNSRPLFSSIQVTHSGIYFKNNINETKEINYYVYPYLNNGGGVGIGDINNDNLPDVYLTSTMGTYKLYLNQGGFKFKDISATAGINQFKGQKTGIVMIDINSDGWLDINVCRAGWEGEQNRKNLMFINKNDGI